MFLNQFTGILFHIQVIIKEGTLLKYFKITKCLIFGLLWAFGKFKDAARFD